MARQTRFISCGYRMAIVSTLIRFLIGPITMGATSLVVGLHGTLLHIAIVQVYNQAQKGVNTCMLNLSYILLVYKIINI